MKDVARLIRAVRNGSPTAAEELGQRDSEVAGGLGAAREQVADVLIDALAHPQASMRSAAAWALLSFRAFAARAAGPLVKLLRDPDPATRTQAAETLGRLGVTEEHLHGAIEALGSDDPLIRVSICQAITWLGPAGRSAVPALMSALEDPSVEVRVQAAVALGEMGADAVPAITPMFDLLATVSAEQEIDIVVAIVNIGASDPAAAPVIRRELAIPRALTRSASAALRRAGGLDETSDVEEPHAP